MSISAREQYLIEHPEIVSVIGSPAIVSGVGSHIKVADGFRDLLKKIKKDHPRSTIRY